jgi:hypothetical protein
MKMLLLSLMVSSPVLALEVGQTIEFPRTSMSCLVGAPSMRGRFDELRLNITLDRITSFHVQGSYLCDRLGKSDVFSGVVRAIDETLSLDNVNTQVLVRIGELNLDEQGTFQRPVARTP